MKNVLSLFLVLFIIACEQNEIQQEAVETAIPVKTVPAKSEAVSVDFKTLSNFELPIADPTMADQEDLKFISDALPVTVSTLQNQQIKIKGFMVPLKFNKEEKIISFMFTADQGACCQGKIPALNEVIYCSTEKAYPDLRDTYIEVSGKFLIKPELDKSNDSVSLYTMEIDSIKELQLKTPAKDPGLSF